VCVCIYIYINTYISIYIYIYIYRYRYEPAKGAGDADRVSARGARDLVSMKREREICGRRDRYTHIEYT